MLKSAIKIIGSLRCTIVLIICLIVVFLIGLVVPQKLLLGKMLYLSWKRSSPGLVGVLETLGMTDIYSAPYTLMIWGLFFLNLLVVISKRIPLVWKRCTEVEVRDLDPNAAGHKGGTVLHSESRDMLQSRLAANGYMVASNEHSFRAVKNRFSPLATIVFHVSFFLVLAGAVTASYTKFRAVTGVAVGETFSGKYNWARAARFADEPDSNFRVTKIAPQFYKRNRATSLEIKVELEGEKVDVSINKPLKVGPTSFVVKEVDILPLFVFSDEDGKELGSAFVKLEGVMGNEDSFEMAGYKFRTLFYTDYSIKDREEPEVESLLPQKLRMLPMQRAVRQPKEVVDPAFSIIVYRDKQFISEGDLRLGGSLEFDGKILEFPEYDYWVKFYVSGERGLGILYTGFVVMLISLAVRFTMYRREISGTVFDEKLVVKGSTEFYPALFEDEFKKMITSRPSTS